MHTKAIYTKAELSTIYDALVAPLAREIHSLDDLEHLESMASADDFVSVSSGCELSLGGLLHDVCSKIVPLTSALQVKRRAAHAVIDCIRKRCYRSGDACTKEQNASSSMERTTLGNVCHKCSKCFRSFTRAAALKLHLSSHL